MFSVCVLWARWYCSDVKLSFPQNGSTDLKPLDAAAGGGGGDDDVTGLLSALVVWTESRREEGPGRPLGHAGQREHFDLWKLKITFHQWIWRRRGCTSVLTAVSSAATAQISALKSVFFCRDSLRCFVPSTDYRAFPSRRLSQQCSELCRGATRPQNVQNERIYCTFFCLLCFCWCISQVHLFYFFILTSKFW